MLDEDFLAPGLFGNRKMLDAFSHNGSPGKALFELRLKTFAVRGQRCDPLAAQQSLGNAVIQEDLGQLEAVAK